MRRVLVLWALSLATGAFGQERTLLSIGDSVTWGYQPNDLSRSAGDKGFVRLFADWLGQQYGARPAVTNVAVPGESTSSYFDTSEIGALLNSNYPLFFRPSQRSKVDSSITSILGAGRQIPYATFALGANDLLELLDSTFLGQPLSVQMQQADQAIAAADGRLTTALNAVRQRLPATVLVMPGYYDPYPPSRPEHPVASYAIPRLNAMIEAKAFAYGARYVPTAAPFVGRELELTWIGEDDVHPRDSGYTVIFEQIVSHVRLVSGRIDLEGLAGPMPETVVFQARDGGTTHVRAVHPEPDGTFRLLAPAGLLQVSLKHTHWLRRTIGADTRSGDVSGLVVALLNGDVDGDNEVAIGDYALLSTAFGASHGEPGYLPTADLDEDQTIDIGDFAILSASFGQFGDD